MPLVPPANPAFIPDMDSFRNYRSFRRHDRSLLGYLRSSQFSNALQVLQRIQDLDCENLFNKSDYLAEKYSVLAEGCIDSIGKTQNTEVAESALQAAQKGLSFATDLMAKQALLYMKAAAHYYRNECDDALDALRNVTILHNYPEHVARIEEQKANPAQSPLVNNPFAYQD